MNSTKLISAGKKLAILSFIGGTILLLVFYFTNSVDIAFLGYLYIAVMGALNLVVFGLLCSQYFKDKPNQANILKTLGLLVLNIPVVLAYSWFALLLFDTMRITFINSTNSTLTDINIYGCEEKHIQKLSPGQSKEVWIKIPGDCGISVAYIVNGKSSIETVEGYVTKSAGKISSFKLGLTQTP